MSRSLEKKSNERTRACQSRPAPPHAGRSKSMPRSLPVVAHAGPVSHGASLSHPHALSALAALGQPTRLEIFQMLMRAEPAGLRAGSLAEQIGCPHNTLSTHLAILARADLVRGVRDGRAIIYRANVDGMRSLLSYLVNDCCNGHPELCGLSPKSEGGCG